MATLCRADRAYRVGAGWVVCSGGRRKPLHLDPRRAAVVVVEFLEPSLEGRQKNTPSCSTAARSGTPARDSGGLRQRSVLRVAAELAHPTMRPSLAADIAGPAPIAADAAHLPAAPDRPARAVASSHQRLNPSPSTSAARDRRGPESRRSSGGGRRRPLPSCVSWPSKLLAASTLVAARYRY